VGGIKTTSLEPTNPDEGMRIGDALFKKGKISGVDIKEQTTGTFIYNDRVNEESFTGANMDYANDSFIITGHQFLDGDAVNFTGELPSPLRTGITYFLVQTGQGSDMFLVSGTKGGPPLDLQAPAGEVNGNVKSNAFGNIGLRSYVPDNAVVTRTWVERLDTGGSSSGSGVPPEPSISFHLETDGDLVAPADQNDLFVGAAGPSFPLTFIDGKQNGLADNFIKLTAKRELTMKVEMEELTFGDYMITVEYVESQ